MDADSSIHSSFHITNTNPQTIVLCENPPTLRRCPKVRILQHGADTLALGENDTVHIQTDYEYEPIKKIHTITMRKLGQFTRLEYKTEGAYIKQ